MTTTGLIALAIVVAAIALYNRLVRLRNRVREAWSDIDVQLTRRADLIPNLVAAVRGYMQHEHGVLEAVTAARAKATALHIDPDHATPEDLAAFAAAQDAVGGALGKLLAVAENYPDLKASRNFLELQRELTDTENKLQAARRFYNTVVQEYNTALEQFPGVLFARLFGFRSRAFFRAADGAAAVPTVDFKKN